MFGDAQLNNVSAVQTRTHSMVSDDLVSATSIRPPTLDLWSEAVLRGVIDKTRSLPDEVVFFVGDAANTSCVNEYQRFLEDMHDLPWFGAPGNHDGYYMGNLAYPADAVIAGGRNTWQGACQFGHDLPPETLRKLEKLERTVLGELNFNSAQRTLSKAVGIWMYLEDLSRRVALDRDPMNSNEWHLESDYRVFDSRGSYVIAGKRLPVHIVAAVGATGVDPAHPKDTPYRSWQAYLTQDVELPDGQHALLIDTSDYALQPPGSKPSQLWAVLTKIIGDCDLPGECGRVDAHQGKTLQRLAAESTKKFMLIGHHDWQAISAAGAENLRPLLRSPRFITYFSGHAHQPTAIVSALTPDNASGWEVNLASITDVPMEFAHFMISDSAPGKPTTIDATILSSKLETQRCPLDGSEEAELDYGTVSSYVKRALDVYHWLLEGLAEKNEATMLPACGRACVMAKLDDLDGAMHASTAKQRRVLSEIAEFDRQNLMIVPTIADIERACASWASDTEAGKHAPARPVNYGYPLKGTRTFAVWANPFRPSP